MRCRWPLLLPLVLAACAAPRPAARPDAVRFAVDSVATGTAARLIGLDAASDGTVWAAGSGGTWARSLDGGRSWTTGTVPDADTLQFRDVHAFDALRAVLLSIGPGTASRVYTTDDGGASWALRWTNPDPRAFYDCMAFDGTTGFAFSDAVPLGTGGAYRLPMVASADGGRSWRDATDERSFDVPEGTGAFASSGTCAVSIDGRTLLATNHATGDAPAANVSVWAGNGPWKTMALPFALPDAMRGVATLAVQGDAVFAGLLGAVDGRMLYRADRSLALGGVARVTVRVPTARGTEQATAATWTALPPLPIQHVYGLAASPKALVATGPDGLAASPDRGRTWRLLTRADLWSAVRVDDRTFVAVGRGGRAVRIAVE